MMKEPKELNSWDFSDKDYIPDGYDMNTIPALTRDNFNILIEEHNNLVEVVNMICDKTGIIFNDKLA
jgi:hypothetical protein